MMSDAFRSHGVELSSREMTERINDLLQRLELAPDVAGVYPHQLSGGQRQRYSKLMRAALQPVICIKKTAQYALRRLIAYWCVTRRLRFSL